MKHKKGKTDGQRRDLCPSCRTQLRYLRHFENTAKMGEWVADALELLKEQEAVEPEKTAYQRVDHTIACRYRCGTCGMSIFPSYKYCPFCGQAVKWE